MNKLNDNIVIFNRLINTLREIIILFYNIISIIMINI